MKHTLVHIGRDSVRYINKVRFFYCKSHSFGCGSSDLYLCLTDPDADPGGPKTYGSCGSGTVVKCHKEVKNSRDQGFPYSFCLMIDGSGAGSVLVTNGCGSGSTTLVSPLFL